MTTDLVIFEEVQLSHNYAFGVVRLNRPKALNALNYAMILAIQNQLNSWSEDAKIVGVILSSTNEKAFCAGGDVQALYNKDPETRQEIAHFADQYFTAEYTLDHTLHTYKKPIIAWGQGIIMGGGYGLFSGADYRVIGKKSRIAMPEITIGLFPDVGASYMLNKLPGNLGRFIGLTGSILEAGDALALSLASHLVEDNTYDPFITALKGCSWSNDQSINHNNISAQLTKFKLDEGLDAKIIRSQARLDPIFDIEDTQTLVATFCDDTDFSAIYPEDTSLQEWLTKAQNNLKHGSPLSAKLIDKHLTTTRDMTLAEVFQQDLVLAVNILRQSEFSEGVRALLIDKDRNPQWLYSHADVIPTDVIDSYFVPPWDQNPLQTIK